MRHPGWYLCDVGSGDRERLVAYAVLGGTFEKYVRLFGVMYVESGATAGVRLGDDERERPKPYWSPVSRYVNSPGTR